MSGFAFSQDNPAGTQQHESSRTGKEKPLSEKDDVVRISVTLVQVDAVVTDRQGKQVTDLKPSDFEILEDGRPQHITNFSYIAMQPDSPASPKLETRSKVPLPIVPPARLRLDQVRRTVALVVDDLGLSFESTVAVREALKKFVDQQMQPGDLVAIIRTGAGMGALQRSRRNKRFCSDRPPTFWRRRSRGLSRESRRAAHRDILGRHAVGRGRFGQRSREANLRATSRRTGRSASAERERRCGSGFRSIGWPGGANNPEGYGTGLRFLDLQRSARPKDKTAAAGSAGFVAQRRQADLRRQNRSARGPWSA